MPTRTAKAEWIGDLRTGKGSMHPASKAFTATYCLDSIMGDTEESNPIEVLATSIAGCLCGALAAALSAAGHQPHSIETTANVQVERAEGVHSITTITLQVRADIPGIDPETLRQITERAAQTCPVGKALSSVELVLETELV